MSRVLDLAAGPASDDRTAGAVARLAGSVPAYQLWVGEGADLFEVVHSQVLPALASASEARKRVRA
jgi:hypothetical protein